MSKKLVITSITAILLVGFVALVINNYKTKTSLKYEDKTAEELKPTENSQDEVNAAINQEAASNQVQRNSELLKLLPNELFLGDKNAPILLIEYASLSCPHCADFSREAFDKLKTEYIDAGKLKFVFRHFPLNQPALVASMLAECKAIDHPEQASEKYFSTLKVLFKTQDTWAFDEKFSEKLSAIAQLDGMSADRFQKCTSDKSLQEKILRERMEAGKSLQLRSTPSFFIDGEIVEGFVDYKALKKIIDAKLAK
jgi:protein-disulfide isomerase